MKSQALVLSLLLLLTPSYAHAAQFNFKTATCKEFVALPDKTLDLAALWLEGFLSDEEDPESMEVDLMDTDADEIKANCLKNPKANLIKTVESMDPDSE